MGREVRRVPKDWKHPTDLYGRHIPLFYEEFHGAYSYYTEAWDRGMKRDYDSEDPRALKPKGRIDFDLDSYEKYAGPPPTPETHMPDWPDEERTHLQMYEDTSEGTPISPVMETPEELARWLADNGASSFGSMGATYRQWLAMIRKGYSCGAVLIREQEGIANRIVSGVELSESVKR